MQNNTQSQVVI